MPLPFGDKSYLEPLGSALTKLRQSGGYSEEETKQMAKLNPSSVSSHSIFDIENVGNDALFWLLLLMLGKKDPKSVERILISLFRACGDALEAYCRAGVGNRISAWGSGRLLSLFMERFGLITQIQAMDYSSGINIITGAEVAEELTTLVPWKALSPDIDFPTTVVLGDKGRTFKVTRESK